MLKNYLRIAYRNITKSGGFSTITIVGLGIGMAAFLFIVQYVRFERSYEDFRADADNTYRIALDIYNGSEYVVTDCETHAPMGPLLKSKMPEVVDFVRMFHNDGLQEIQVGGRRFLEEGIYYADPSAFRIFSLNVLQGDPNSFTAPLQAVLTESMALKYFGRVNVTGEAIEIDKNLYHITAVIADVPANTHLKFTILLSHASLAKLNSWYNDVDNWGGNNEYTYLLMTPGTDLVSFNAKLKALSIELKDKMGNARYVAEPVKDIHLHSNKTYEPEVNGSAKAVNFLMIIAVFILVMAWVNYINLSTARAIERAREVGIRKVMGSVRTQLVLQFLSESVIVNMLAAGLALLLFQVLLPMFRDLTGQPLPLAYWQDSIFWFIFSGLLVAGAFFSGLYPAFVLSSFQPAAVLKGKFRSSSHGQLLRRSLVIFQFASTVVLVIGMVTVYRQVNYLRTYDLGMNIAQTLVVRAPSTDGPDSLFQSAFQTLKTELLRNPEIKKIARSESLPGLSLHELSSTMFTRVGQESANGSYEYYHFSVDADFMPALDMKLVAGRSFESGTLNQDQIIVNEEAANRLGFRTPEEAIGARVTYKTRWKGDPSTIIGVMHNFYQRSPKEKHIPMVFRYGEGASYFSIRLNSNHLHETVASVKNTWGTVFPNSVFHYFFLDEKYDQQYQSDRKFGQIITTFSGLAVLIACLGLFGLSSYTIVQRTKEIGIRKVLGASVTQIVTLLTSDFAKVVLLAAVLALPVAWFGMEQWLSGYAVRVSPNVWVFVLPVVLILAIGLLTVSFQTIKSAVANPTESLKQE